MAKVEVIGMEEALQKALMASDALVARVKSALPRAVEGMGEVMRDQAKAIAPVGTPESTGDPKYIRSEAYKRSIRAIRRGVKQIGNKTIGGVTAGKYILNPNTQKMVDYQLIQPRWGTRWNRRGIELGFSKQAPRGVLVPSAHKSAQAMRNTCNKWVIRAIKSNKGKLTI